MHPSQLWSSISLLTHLRKEGPNIVDEEIWGGLGRKMITSVVDLAKNDVSVISLGKGPNKWVVVGKVRETKRDGGGFGW
jgi:hypothetical protein